MDKRRQLADCLEAFRRGTLTEATLRQTLEELGTAKPKYQDLLYLQTSTTALESSVHGMALVEKGAISDGPPDPADWPYKTPLQAICDGWRIVQFPNMALLLDESKTYGLGCEFILERWH